jgi:hypothetical protein
LIDQKVNVDMNHMIDREANRRVEKAVACTYSGMRSGNGDFMYDTYLIHLNDVGQTVMVI